MNRVLDASAMVAALVDDGPDGEWAEQAIVGSALHAPHLLQIEASNVLRRLAKTQQISSELATLAHIDLGDFPVENYPFAPFADRIWSLRHNITAYDAWYVSLAEALECPLITLDARLARAASAYCEVVTR
jgi:predicted nucleic acid-binding protein